MSFLRTFENFGNLVTLLGQCLNDVNYFLMFMFSWIIFFWVEYLILGMEVDDSEYPFLNYYMKVFIHAWRNAIGDI